jgi:hypothetical protein
VFPLARDHEGYNGEKITHDGTVNTPGYINTKEAHAACNDTSTALKSKPVAGNAVIFYSQGPDSTLDPYSLHGGCPPIAGEKWSANVWIWNRAKPGKDQGTCVCMYVCMYVVPELDWWSDVARGLLGF